MLYEFKNIVGTIEVSEITNMPDKMPNLSMPRFFLIKRSIRLDGYYNYIYVTGFAAGAEHRCLQCFDMFGEWRYSFNDNDFLEKEVIEIIFP